MSLDDWLKNGWLTAQPASPQEIRELLAVVDRDLTGYERVGAVSDQEAREMLVLAEDLRRQVEAWIRTTHPALL